MDNTTLLLTNADDKGFPLSLHFTDIQAVCVVGAICCANSDKEDCTCRLKLLNQDSSCKPYGLSTERELPNATV